MKYPELKNYVGGIQIANTTDRFLDLISPLDGSLLTKIPLSTSENLNHAVVTAKKAFETWSKTPIKERVQIFSDTKRC